jgi:hypothetical protein
VTRVEVHIDRLVLHGVPAELARAFGPRVEARIAELAVAAPLRRAPGEPAGHSDGRGSAVVAGDGLVDLVARRVWAAAREEVGGS